MYKINALDKRKGDGGLRSTTPHTHAHPKRNSDFFRYMGYRVDASSKAGTLDGMAHFEASTTRSVHKVIIVAPVGKRGNSL